MLVINTDASSRKEKPRSIIGYIIFKGNKDINQEVQEIDLTKEIEIKRRNETIYLELLSVLFALEYLLSIDVKIDSEIDTYNDNTTIIYILNSLFKNKRKVTKIEEVLNIELERARYIISRIGTVNFKYINTKENQAHKIIKKILLVRKWEEDIKELKIEEVREGEFSVQTVKKNKFLVNLINNTCTCRYFSYDRKICKHIIACRRYK